MENAQAVIPSLSINGLRGELGLTLADMGERVGLSKSQMHEVERTGRASIRVAIAIEELSGGRIDAAELCDDVKIARHGLSVSSEMEEPSPGKISEISQVDAASCERAA